MLPLKSASLKYTTVQPKSDNKPSGQEMKNYKIPKLKIKCQFLDRQGIFNNIVYSIHVLRLTMYYEFVHQIYEILRKEKRDINFTSVELYSETGCPLASSPNIYFEPLSNWELRDNDLIYAYPKKLFNNYFFESDIDCEEFVINIQLKDSNIRKEFKFNKENISYFDLKILISLDMHIPIDCISIHYFNLASQCEEIALDNMDIQKEFIDKIKLSFTISDTYSNNDIRVQSVNTSCFPSSSLPNFHTLNIDIQELVREYGENRDKDRLLRRLGLLRKISCSPPLVYSLYLLFTQSPTSLPHRIAINEGIITTISLLSTTSDRPTISKFPQLWMHIEEHALTPDLQLTEINETTFISKSTQGNTKDSRTRRLLKPLLPDPDTIIAKENAPSIYAIHNYSKIIIILDLSNEMSLTFLGNPTFQKPNSALTHRVAAIKVIETLIEYLTSSQCKYLLSAIVISNNPKVQNGYSEIIKPTVEYVEVLKGIKSYIQELKPTFYLRNELPDGLIVTVLNYCIDSYATSSKNLKTEIFLFTNSESRLIYNGTKENPFIRKLCNSSCVLNNIVLSEKTIHYLEELSKLTIGVHLTYKSISRYLLSGNNISNLTISVLKGMLSVSGLDANFGTYEFLSSKLTGQLIGIEEFLENCERDINEYQKAITAQSTISNCMHVLGSITAYIKSPNPFCKLYLFRNEILKWIVFMQGPTNSPFEDSLLILELYFGELYPHHPPKLRFLSSVYHPNVDNAGHICHPILIEDYSPNVSLRQILDAIHSMLAQPIISHAVRSKVLEIAQWNAELYNQIVNNLCETLSLKNKKMSAIEQDFKIEIHNVLSNPSSVPHPPTLICPITNKLFDNPVMTPEGNTFEHRAILEHIECNHTDPISNTPLRSSDLIPNRAIADAIYKYKKTLVTKGLVV